MGRASRIAGDENANDITCGPRLRSFATGFPMLFDLLPFALHDPRLARKQLELLRENRQVSSGSLFTGRTAILRARRPKVG